MILTLEVTGRHASNLGADGRKEFDGAGGLIGRSPDNDWVLADEYVSGHHARIDFRNGQFFLEDTSTNGTSMNSPDNRLQRGRPYPLKTGDRLYIDSYEIRVSIAAPRASPAPLQPPSQPLSLPMPLPVEGRDEADPIKALKLNVGRDKPAPRAMRAADVAHVSPVQEGFIPAPVREAEPNAESSNPEDTSGPDDIPTNYDPFQDDGFSPAPPVRTPKASPPPRSPQPSQRQQAPQSPPPDLAVPTPAPPVAAGSDLDFASLLRGAGLQGVEVSPELAANFGEILRIVISGLMEVLQTRERIKHEFRMRTTTFKTSDNNPLKKSANLEEALHKLLVMRNAAYMGPVEAFDDAIRDVRSHQMAMLAGVRLAYEAMLAEFDPARLQEQFDRQIKKGALIGAPAKLRYWDLYADRFRDRVRDPDACFRVLFGDQFAKAYEEHLEKLRDASRLDKK